MVNKQKTIKTPKDIVNGENISQKNTNKTIYTKIQKHSKTKQQPTSSSSSPSSSFYISSHVNMGEHPKTLHTHNGTYLLLTLMKPVLTA